MPAATVSPSGRPVVTTVLWEGRVAGYSHPAAWWRRDWGVVTNEHPRRCGECSGPLAHDQRYCLRCGARRGPLPARIGLTIGEIYERGRRVPHSGTALSAPPEPAPSQSDPLVPAARSAAVAILLMLAFGCVVGSLTTPGGVEALASQLVVAVSPSSAAPVRSASTAANGAGNGSPSHNGSAPAPSPAPPAAPPAAVPQQTVTVGSPPTPTSATTPTTPSSPTSLLGLPPIKHVWEIVLSQQGYNQAFATSQGHPYLGRTLRRQGKLIAHYYGVAGSPLANEIALLSGQGPTPDTIAGCPTFADVAPASIGRFDQIKGRGCLYPGSASTLADQLANAGLQWRAYVQGIGEKPSSQTTSSSTATTSTTSTAATSTTSTAAISTTSTGTTSATSTTPNGAPAVPASQPCPHPAFGGDDPYQSASVGAPYATWRNPFVYFRSVLTGGQCASSDVGLHRLATDLTRVSTTPSFSYLSPGPCDDGSDQPCAVNAPAGLAQADRFLRTVVPKIERSPAYQKDGLIAITFDGAPQTGLHVDLTSCCDQPTFPNLLKPSTPTSTSSTSSTTATSTSTPTPPSTTSTTPCTTSSSSSTTTSTTTAALTLPSTTSTSSSTCTPASALGPGTTPGGGQVGLLLISRYVQANSVDEVGTFNHFSLLKSIEDLFALKPLGYARDSALPVFDAAIFKSAKQ